MRKPSIKHIILLKAIVFTIAFVSCSNDIKKVNLVSKKYTFPDLTAKDASFLYTDSARIVMNVTAPELKRYSSVQKPYTVFEKGIKVVYFSQYPDTNSKIFANYAIRWINEQMWEAKGNVIARNTKGDILNTEYLVWDEKKRIIYSNKFVKITTKSDVILGEGFEADQAFERWKILKVKGLISVGLGNDSLKK